MTAQEENLRGNRHGFQSIEDCSERLRWALVEKSEKLVGTKNNMNKEKLRNII